MVNLNKQTQIRTQLQNKVFDQFGKNAILYKASTPVYNSRGELEGVQFTEQPIILVNYNITNEKRAVEKWGSWNPGDQEAIIPYDVNVSKNDEVAFEGKTYLVDEVRIPELPEALVNIVHLVEKQS